MGRCLVGRTIQLDRLDHLTPTLIRRHRLQQLRPTPQNADPGWPAHLVAAKRIKVTTQFAHVDRQVRRRLRTIHQQKRVRSMNRFRYLFDRIDRANAVRDMGHRNQLRPLAQKIFELVDEQLSIRVDLDIAQPSAGLSGEYLPGDDVRMVFEYREKNLVSATDVRSAPAISHQVDRFRRASHEDDLVRLGSTNERCDLPTGGLVGSGRTHRELV